MAQFRNVVAHLGDVVAQLREVVAHREIWWLIGICYGSFGDGVAQLGEVVANMGD